MTERGHEAVAAAPSTGVNVLTGEGLPEVLDGASVVVDVSNSPSFDDGPALEFFETSATNVLAAARDAGVKHLVALSVVGTDYLAKQSGYFNGEAAAGTAHRRRADPVLDRPCDAVLRVLQHHRRLGHQR